MPVSVLTGPDGKDYEVMHPAGASDDDIKKYAASNYKDMTPEAPKVDNPAGNPDDGSYTGSILPFKRDAQGNTTLAVPTMVQGVIDAMKAPGDVLTGKIKPGTDESKEAASNVAGLIAGGSFGKGLAKTTETELGQASKRMGINLAESKTPEAIASELGRATDANVDRLANTVGSHQIQARPVGQLGETAEAGLRGFQSRKADESALWTQAEQRGNAINLDATDQITKLQDLRKDVAARIASGEDTPDVKKSQALLDRVLGELGSPTQPEQSTLEKIVQKGGTSTRTTGLHELPEDIRREQNTLQQSEPTNVRGTGMASQTTQTPTASKIVRQGEERLKTTEPYTVSTKTIKGAPPVPTRQTVGSDFVRAHRAANDPTYGLADPKIISETKNILKNGLSEASKQDKSFRNIWLKANQATQRNADLYRNDVKAAKFGFDEDTLKQVQTSLKSGRPIPTATLETLNKGLDHIKTPEDVLFLQRQLPKMDFVAAMRAKTAQILTDAGTNAQKVAKQRPLLESVMQSAGVPKATIKRELDDLEMVSKGMAKYDIPSKPVAEVASKNKRRIQSVVKAIMSFSPKYRLYHGVQALMPETAPAGNTALQSFRGETLPKTYRDVSGPMIGSVLGANSQDKQ